ncbi:MAG: hypothetical protein ACRD3B_04925, partial [Candidatus Sulfotelmatobacter sp.]
SSFGSFLPSRLVGFATSNSNPGAGADIVMESITLKILENSDVQGAIRKGYKYLGIGESDVFE